MFISKIYLWIKYSYLYFFPTRKNIIKYIKINDKKVLFKDTLLSNKNLKIIEIIKWADKNYENIDKIIVGYSQIDNSNDILHMIIQLPKNKTKYIFNNRFFSTKNEIPYKDPMDYEEYFDYNLIMITSELKFDNMNY
jgi:hypothetical protein